MASRLWLVSLSVVVSTVAAAIALSRMLCKTTKDAPSDLACRPLVSNQMSFQTEALKRASLQEEQERSNSIALLSLRATRQQVVIALIAVEVAWFLGSGEWNPWSIPVGSLTLISLLSIPSAPSITRMEEISYGLAASGAVVIILAWFIDPYFQIWAPDLFPHFQRISLFFDSAQMSEEEVYQMMFVLTWLCLLPLAMRVTPKLERRWNSKNVKST